MAEHSTSKPSELPEVEAGAVFVVPYPFCRTVYEHFDADGPVKIKSWQPGVRFEYGPNAYGDDPDTVEEYDGMGAQILTVVAVFKPGRFPTRVFYTRKWRAPNGHEFGKPALRIKVVSAFRTLIRGYRYQHPPSLEASAEYFATELANSRAALTEKGE